MIPDWAMRLPLNLIYCKASDMKLDSYLIAAICWQESRGFVYAARFEPKYRWTTRIEHFAKLNRISKDTEENLQKTSFGLMQIMGGTARHLGYDGALPALYKPENNLYWGCRYLAELKKKYDSIEDIAAAYNAGSAQKSIGGYLNQPYVDNVMSYYQEISKG